MSLVKVRYKGLSDIREMSKKDLADAGVGVDGDLRWARPGNGPWGVHNVVYVENPSDELMEVFKMEGTFTVTDVSEEGAPEGEPIITGQALDDTGSFVRDNTTGQESVKQDSGSNPAVSATPQTKSGKAKS